MSDISFKRLGADDSDLMIQCRIDYCMRDNPACDGPEFSRFSSCVAEWTRSHLATGNLWGYAGFCDTSLVCFAGVLVYQLPPVLSHCDRTLGHILSFFTYPEFRRRGYGDSLMKFIVNDARSLGISQLVLNATDMGEPVYRKNGFAEPAMRYMVLDVTGG